MKTAIVNAFKQHFKFAAIYIFALYIINPLPVSPSIRGLLLCFAATIFTAILFALAWTTISKNTGWREAVSVVIVWGSVLFLGDLGYWLIKY